MRIDFNRDLPLTGSTILTSTKLPLFPTLLPGLCIGRHYQHDRRRRYQTGHARHVRSAAKCSARPVFCLPRQEGDANRARDFGPFVLLMRRSGSKSSRQRPPKPATVYPARGDRRLRLSALVVHTCRTGEPVAPCHRSLALQCVIAANRRPVSLGKGGCILRRRRISVVYRSDFGKRYQAFGQLPSRHAAHWRQRCQIACFLRGNRSVASFPR